MTLKRVFDVLAASVGLVITSPALAAASVAVLLEDGRPVLFTQERVGKDGRTFRIFKLRTMASQDRGHAALVTSQSDPRITRVGELLRRTKVDEIPQFINVLRGDMSLVGPRPEVPKYVACWPEPDRQLILSVRPGITDPVTLENRWEQWELAMAEDPESYYLSVLLPRKLVGYKKYVSSQTFTGDLKILAKTVWLLLQQRTPEPKSASTRSSNGQCGETNNAIERN